MTETLSRHVTSYALYGYYTHEVTVQRYNSHSRIKTVKYHDIKKEK